MSDSDFITLVDEEGKEHEFEIEAILDVDEIKYAVLIPMDEEYADSNEAVIMRFGLDEDGEEVLYDIESDAEWERVAGAYDDIVEELEEDGYDEVEENE
jgi:putative Holliday junction resolvase